MYWHNLRAYIRNCTCVITLTYKIILHIEYFECSNSITNYLVLFLIFNNEMKLFFVLIIQIRTNITFLIDKTFLVISCVEHSNFITNLV